MHRDRLQRLIDAYGADPTRWPDDERDAARALISETPNVRAVLTSARQLDELLDGFAPVVETGAEDRLERALSDLPRQNSAAPALLTAFWPRAAMLAAASVAGVIIGLNGIDGNMSITADVDIVSLVGEPDTISLLE